MQELNLLNDKLEALLKKHAQLKADNAKLQQKIAEQAQQIQSLDEKITGLEENLLATNMDAAAVMNDGDKEVMKKQLDTVIGEIDKILATLND